MLLKNQSRGYWWSQCSYFIIKELKYLLNYDARKLVQDMTKQPLKIKRELGP